MSEQRLEIDARAREKRVYDRLRARILKIEPGSRSGVRDLVLLLPDLAVLLGAWGPNPGHPADFNGDDIVNAADLALLLGNWGPNPGHPADFNDDNFVNAADLAQLLGAWGPCP